jgi:hypothetical protein
MKSILLLLLLVAATMVHGHKGIGWENRIVQIEERADDNNDCVVSVYKSLEPGAEIANGGSLSHELLHERGEATVEAWVFIPPVPEVDKKGGVVYDDLFPVLSGRNAFGLGLTNVNQDGGTLSFYLSWIDADTWFAANKDIVERLDGTINVVREAAFVLRGQWTHVALTFKLHERVQAKKTGSLREVGGGERHVPLIFSRDDDADDDELDADVELLRQADVSLYVDGGLGGLVFEGKNLSAARASSNVTVDTTACPHADCSLSLWRFNETNYFEGFSSEVRVWRGARTLAELELLMFTQLDDAQRAGASLALYYPMSNCQGGDTAIGDASLGNAERHDAVEQGPFFRVDSTFPPIARVCASSCGAPEGRGSCASNGTCVCEHGWSGDECAAPMCATACGAPLHGYCAGGADGCRCFANRDGDRCQDIHIDGSGSQIEANARCERLVVDPGSSATVLGPLTVDNEADIGGTLSLPEPALFGDAVTTMRIDVGDTLRVRQSGALLAQSTSLFAGPLVGRFATYGSHGGLAFDAQCTDDPAATPCTVATYGNFSDPKLPGAAASPSAGALCPGGGVIELAARTAIIDGLVSVDGLCAGAAGSISIRLGEAERLAGTGLISASAGGAVASEQRDSQPPQFASGGRIAIFGHTVVEPSLRVLAYGREGAAPGTIYLWDAAGNSTLIVANPSSSAAIFSTSLPSGHYAPLSSLIVSYANLSSSSLDVTNCFVNYGHLSGSIHCESLDIVPVTTTTPSASTTTTTTPLASTTTTTPLQTTTTPSASTTTPLQTTTTPLQTTTTPLQTTTTPLQTTTTPSASTTTPLQLPTTSPVPHHHHHSSSLADWQVVLIIAGTVIVLFLLLGAALLFNRMRRRRRRRARRNFYQPLADDDMHHRSDSLASL